MSTYRDLYPDRDQWSNPSWFDTAGNLSVGRELNRVECCVTNEYICTRPKWHSGPHVADDGIKVLDVWESKPSDTTLLDWLGSLPKTTTPAGNSGD